MDALPRLFQDIGERFRSTGMLRRSTLAHRSASVEHPVSFSQEVAPTLNSLNKSSLLNVLKLSGHHEKQLTHVLEQNRVELIWSSDATNFDKDAEIPAHEAQVSVRVPIAFSTVLHSNPPVPYFSDEDHAMQVLGDVTEILKIFHTAKLLIEGHMATPPEKIDKWAHELARNRAEIVKATIVSFGIEANRISTSGLPGNFGNNRHDVVLKIIMAGKQNFMKMILIGVLAISEFLILFYVITF